MSIRILCSYLLFFSYLTYAASEHELHIHTQIGHSFKKLEDFLIGVQGGYRHIIGNKYAIWGAIGGAKPYPNTSWKHPAYRKFLSDENGPRNEIVPAVRTVLFAYPSGALGIRGQLLKQWILGGYINHEWLKFFSIQNDSGHWESIKCAQLHRTALGIEGVYLPGKILVNVQAHMHHHKQDPFSLGLPEFSPKLLKKYIVDEPFGLTINTTFDDLTSISFALANFSFLFNGYYLYHPVSHGTNKNSTNKKKQHIFGIGVGGSYRYASYLLKLRVLLDQHRGIQLHLNGEATGTFALSQRTRQGSRHSKIRHYLTRPIDARVLPLTVPINSSEHYSQVNKRALNTVKSAIEKYGSNNYPRMPTDIQNHYANYDGATTRVDGMKKFFENAVSLQHESDLLKLKNDLTPFVEKAQGLSNKEKENLIKALNRAHENLKAIWKLQQGEHPFRKNVRFNELVKNQSLKVLKSELKRLENRRFTTSNRELSQPMKNKIHDIVDGCMNQVTVFCQTKKVPILEYNILKQIMKKEIQWQLISYEENPQKGKKVYEKKIENDLSGQYMKIISDKKSALYQKNDTLVKIREEFLRLFSEGLTEIDDIRKTHSSTQGRSNEKKKIKDVRITSSQKSKNTWGKWLS